MAFPFPSSSSQFGQGLGSLFGGIFGGGGGHGYEDASKELQKYFGQAAGYQKPFYEAGTGAIPDFQEWLSGMKNPSEFINNLEGQYQESPHSKYLQDQAMRASTNMASASGLTGSTPLAMQMQEYASNIASGDMDKWLQHVLGVNTQYGSGLDTLMGRGQNSANQLTSLMAELGKLMGGAKMGQNIMKQKQKGDIFGGLGSIFGSFF